MPGKLRQELRRALERQSLNLRYQPIFDLATRDIVGAEALVRWPHPRRGCLRPDAFLPGAESDGLLPQLDRWSLHAACRCFSRWRFDLPDAARLSVSVNVSPWTLETASYPADALTTLSETGLPPDRLVLEVTERGPLSRGAAERLARLQNEDVRIAIDDFGKAGSSIERLASLRVDRLKLDRGLTAAAVGSTRGRDVIRGVVRLARDLGAEVVAEGIEREEQLRGLRDAGCELGQGYLYGRPLEGADFREALGALVRDVRAPAGAGSRSPGPTRDDPHRHPTVHPTVLDAFGAWPAAGRVA